MNDETIADVYARLTLHEAVLGHLMARIADAQPNPDRAVTELGVFLQKMAKQLAQKSVAKTPMGEAVAAAFPHLGQELLAKVRTGLQPGGARTAGG